MTRAVVLVPRRADGGHRDDLWDWCRESWWADLGLRIYEGHHDEHEGLFSRSAALNRAAAAADFNLDGQPSPWDVAVVLDADTIVNPDAVRSAVTLAEASGQITWAFDRWAGLNEYGSWQIRGGYRGDWNEYVQTEFLHTASSCLAVPRALWDDVGGFDEAFVGWGYEDVAFSLACQSIGRGSHRIAGTAWHLWHPAAEATGDSTHPIWQANEATVQPYFEAGWCDYEAMRAVLVDRGQWRRFDL